MFTSNPRTPGLSVSSDHGSTSRANVSPLRENPLPPDSKPYVQLGDTAQAGPSSAYVYFAPDIKPHMQSEDVTQAEPRTSVDDEDEVPRIMRMSQVDRAYERLLRKGTIDADGVSNSIIDPLPPSQIGGSYWTSDEKEAFFTALARYGQDDLPRFATAVSTKTQAEIRAYLILLQMETERSSALGTRTPFDAAWFPVSYEIGVECEAVLAKRADALAKHVLKEDVMSEKAKYGEFWMIDEDLANQVDGLSGSNQPSGDSECPSDVDMDKNDDDNIESEGDAPVGDVKAASTHLPPTSEYSDITTEIPSAKLLIPASLLQLSRTIFMNRPGADHWRKMETLDRRFSRRPALWHSALENFHRIVVEKTRELVRATLLQASSRLCATDARPLVTKSDVKTALDIMNIGPEWRDYWTKLPRRHGIRVHTLHSKYHDGRPTNRYGVDLTYDEVEAELGSEKIPIIDQNVHVKSEREVDDQKGGESQDDEQGQLVTSDDSDSFPSESDGETAAYNSEQEEAEYLDAHDGRASHFEQTGLLRSFAYDTHDITAPNVDEDSLERKAAKRPAKEYIDRRPTQWRKQMKYEPQWVTEMMQRATDP